MDTGLLHSEFLEETGVVVFNLAYMRYTGQWIELFTGLTLDACLAQIRDESWFQP